MKVDKRNKRTCSIKKPHEKYKRAYTCWSSMFRRCYSENWLEKRPTYSKTEVCDEWCVFENFLAWYEENYVEGWQLDKDVLGGSSLYSPETCCFLPHCLNSFLTKREAGVMWNKGRYVMQMHDSGTGSHVRKYFNCYEKAKRFYYESKKAKAESLILQYNICSPIKEGILRFVEENFK